MICQWKRSYKSRDRAVMMMLKTLCCGFTVLQTALIRSQTLEHSSCLMHKLPRIINSAQESRVLRVMVLSWNRCARAVMRDVKMTSRDAHFSRGCKHNRLKEQITRFSQKAGVLCVLAELFLVMFQLIFYVFSGFHCAKLYLRNSYDSCITCYALLAWLRKWDVQIKRT